MSGWFREFILIFNCSQISCCIACIAWVDRAELNDTTSFEYLVEQGDGLGVYEGVVKPQKFALT